MGYGTKTWDKIWILGFVTIWFAVLFVTVHDFHAPIGDWSSLGIARVIGFAIHVCGWTLFTAASISNPFFEVMVRIQKAHGHHVIDTGLYAWIRHPGYVGLSGVFLSMPLLLPSSWICVLSLIGVSMLVIRTVLEDRTLQRELAGYAQYATRVRFRLIPRVW